MAKIAKKSILKDNKKTRDPRGLKKGQTNNKKGAPFAWETYATLIKRYNLNNIDELLKVDVAKIPLKHAMVIKILKENYFNENTDPRLLQWASDREDGKVKEEIEMKTENRNILSFAEAAEQAKKGKK